MKKVDCPLMDECVDDAICFDIHMVVEGCAPKFTAPKKAVQTPDFRKICMNCPNHRDDEKVCGIFIPIFKKGGESV